MEPSVYSILCLLIDRSSLLLRFLCLYVNLGLLGREHLPKANFHLNRISQTSLFKRTSIYLESMDEDLNKLFNSRR